MKEPNLLAPSPLAKYPEVLREAMCICDFLILLGYRYEREIMPAFSNEHVRVILTAEGKQVIFDVGSPGMTEREIIDSWIELVKQRESGKIGRGDLRRNWDLSVTGKNVATYARTLEIKGLLRGTRNPGNRYN